MTPRRILPNTELLQKNTQGLIAGLGLVFFTANLCFAYAQPNPYDSRRAEAIDSALDYTEAHSRGRSREGLFDFDAPPETNIALSPQLRMGASLETEWTIEKNFDLDSLASDERRVVEPVLSLSFLFAPGVFKPVGEIFLNMEGGRQIIDDRERGGRRILDKLQLEQAFGLFSLLKDENAGLNLQIGRQRFVDKRQWLYDEELDGIRLSYGRKPWAMELSASRAQDRNLVGEMNVEEAVNYMFSVSRKYKDDAILKIYNFIRDGKEPRQGDPVFYGFSLQGKDDGVFDYWLNFAYLRGRGGDKKINAFGLDFGGTYEYDLVFKPSLSLGFAYGSGDNDTSDAMDRNFRQTGLQDNEGRFGGITAFKYYGELFDPELSNLSIWTAGAGLRPWRNTSLDLVYHWYGQNYASRDLRNTEIDTDPDGINKDLGQELDCVIGYRLHRSLKISFIIGYFFPGPAFGAADNALFSEAKLRWAF